MICGPGRAEHKEGSSLALVKETQFGTDSHQEFILNILIMSLKNSIPELSKTVDLILHIFFLQSNMMGTSSQNYGNITLSKQ